MKINVNTVIIGGRFLLDWGDDTECQQTCIHGIKLRWLCDKCAAELKESAVTDRQQLKPAIALMLRLANRHFNNDEYERFMILFKILGQRADF